MCKIHDAKPGENAVSLELRLQTPVNYVVRREQEKRYADKATGSQKPLATCNQYCDADAAGDQRKAAKLRRVNAREQRNRCSYHENGLRQSPALS